MTRWGHDAGAARGEKHPGAGRPKSPGISGARAGNLFLGPLSGWPGLFASVATPRWEEKAIAGPWLRSVCAGKGRNSGTGAPARRRSWCAMWRPHPWEGSRRAAGANSRPPARGEGFSRGRLPDEEPSERLFRPCRGGPAFARELPGRGRGAPSWREVARPLGRAVAGGSNRRSAQKRATLRRP